MEFCHFYYNVSWSGPLRVPLDWDTLCFLDLCDFFSHQIREVFHYYFSYRFSIPCSSSSPSGIPSIRILFRFMLSCIPLNPSSFFLSLFFLLLLFLGVFFYFVLQLADPILCFIEPVFESFYCVNSEIVPFISSWPCWLFLCPFLWWYIFQ